MIKKLLFVTLCLVLSCSGVFAALVDGTNCGFVTVAPSADPNETAVSADGWSNAGSFSPTEDGTVTQMGWYCPATANTPNYDIGIYDDSAGSPNNRLAVVANQTSAAGWNTVAISQAITNGTTYWLAVQIDAEAGTTSFDNNASGGTHKYNGPGATSLPDPWSSSGSGNRLIAIYALYTAGGGERRVISVTGSLS